MPNHRSTDFYAVVQDGQIVLNDSKPAVFCNRGEATNFMFGLNGFGLNGFGLRGSTLLVASVKICEIVEIVGKNRQRQSRRDLL